MDFKHTSIKQSALGWVKKSIDDNLATIRSELNIYVEENEPSILNSVEAKLSDLQGVLTMIEQYGAAMLTEEMCSLCTFISNKEQQDEQALEVLLRAVLQLPDYLENIQAGQKDIPIAILPLLNDIRAAKNEDLFSEKLLFLPDLSMHMDDSEFDAIDEQQNLSSRQLAKKLRPAYQYSILGIIRDNDIQGNLSRLTKITEIMEERSRSEQIARFWWIVGALIESVARDNLTLGMSVKMLMGKIDQVLRSMSLKGEKDLLQHQPIELIKNILYYIAQPECDGPKSQAIKTAYRLEQFLPVDDDKDQSNIAGPNQELLKTVSSAVKADLEQVKSSLEIYVNGDMGQTEQLKEIPAELHVISDTLAMIGLGPQRQVIEGQIKVINDVVQGHSPPDQEQLLAMAAELIQVDHALEMMHKGYYFQTDTSEDTSNTASRNFEMDNMLSAVVTAALDDIQKIKGAILDFIKDSTRAQNIELSITLLKETQGALNLLNQERAVTVVKGLTSYLESHDIVDFMDTRRLDQLSQVVVSIEYFLEALGEQRSDADSILDFADSQLQLLLQGKVSEADSAGHLESESENLLIDDDVDEDVEIIEDPTGLINVNLDNIEADIQAQQDEEATPGPAQNEESEEIDETAVMDTGIIKDINTNLEKLQQVLEPDTASEVLDDRAEAEEEAEIGEESLAQLGDDFEIDFDITAHDESLNNKAVQEPEEQQSQEAVLLKNSELQQAAKDGMLDDTHLLSPEDIVLDPEINQQTEPEQPSDLLELVESNEAVERISDFVSDQEEQNETNQVQPEMVEVEVEAEEQLVEASTETEEQVAETEVETESEEQLIKTAAETQEQVTEIESETEELVLEGDAEIEDDQGFKITPVDEDLAVLKPGCDEEILEIYLEEAEEESENIQQQQQDWKLHPEDNNAVKNIRRSFHTIKGSGRLVGAMKIGEFAWDYESLLNRIIDKSVLPSTNVIDAIGVAADALPQLIEELKSGTPPQADIPYLRGIAKALAEFKADRVMDNHETIQQAIEKARQKQEVAQEQETVAGEAEVVSEAQPAGENEQITQSPSDESSMDSAGHETEETPPDPFVLTEIESMPGGEVEEPLPDNLKNSSASQEPLEPNELQIDPELLVIYQQEVESHLNTVNSVLETPHESNELIPTEELYRSLHTINGASRTADITSIGQLASLMEKPLKIIMEQGSALDEEVLQLYREGHDVIKSMTQELVEQRRMPEIPGTLREDLNSLMDSLDNHTVELPSQHDQPSNQFVDTLTMMNVSADSSSSEYDDELVEIFIEEATDLLEMSDHTLHTWAEKDESEEDNPGFGLVMELQRYLHTLKGGAKMAEFDQISDLSHELESLFIAVMDNRLDKSEDLIEALKDSFDLLQKQVEQAKNHQEMDSSDEQILVLHQLRSGHAPQDRSDSAANQDDTTQEDASQENNFVDRRHPDEKHRRLTDEAGSERRTADQDVVKVRSDLLDNLVNSAGEVSIYRARMEQQVSSFGSHLGELGQTISRLKNQLRLLEAETDAQIHFSHRQDAELTQSFDPLEMDRYTQIQELSKSLSESVDDLSSLQHILGDQVKDSETLLLQQSRINTDLQDGLIRSRMVKFSGLTSRLRRLVRQTSSELAKKAELEIRGEQNEVDIKVLDRMVAPLEHIIRNAISHGIETPMERLNKGKSETGTILIEVSRDGSDVVVKISDDGSGVDVNKVRSRALQLGLLGENEVLEDNDVIQFILEPGFSTADHVSQVAGRGVGMDVVDSGIKQLGGTLQISTSDKGATFTARLPFTLSINQAILVKAGEESYALPLINIEGITRIESDQMVEFYQQEKPTLDYAGQQYGLYYLTSLLEITEGFNVSDLVPKVPVILLRSGDLRIALHIDEIIGNREIVVKPLGRQLSQVKGLSGATILADGLVVLILDINGLIRHGVTTQVISDVVEEPVVQEDKSNKVVMVVDDSITMRRVATKLLTRNQFDVVTAKDGVDALAQLEETNPDVMLLDIEMPRMDGFELASHMRNEPQFRDIPIIMITSRTGSKHREHAKQLGVDKYMGKPYQESELIENITALVS